MVSADSEASVGVPGLHALSEVLNRWSERLLFVLMVLMVLVALAQVVCRLFFTALAWTEELSCFILVLASLVGAAIAFKRGSHIAVTFLLELLPPALKKAIAVLAQALGLVFFGIVAVYGVSMMQREAGQLTPALQISMAWIYLMYPAVGSVVVIHFLDGLFGGRKGAGA